MIKREKDLKRKGMNPRGRRRNIKGEEEIEEERDEEEREEEKEKRSNRFRWDQQEWRSQGKRQ